MSGLLGIWLEALFASRASGVWDAIAGLPPRTVYEDPRGGPRDADHRRLLASEFSLRATPTGPDAARLAYTVDTSSLRPGALTASLAHLAPDFPSGPIQAAETLHRADPGLGFLIGIDAPDAGPPRGKIYLQRDRRRPASAYNAARDSFLAACDVSLGAAQAVADTVSAPIGFAAADLVADRPPAAKLYFELLDRTSTTAALERLAPPLADILRALPTTIGQGRFAHVLSARLAGDAIRDITLHLQLAGAVARAEQVIEPELTVTWDKIRHLARQTLGYDLDTTYVSWTAGDRVQQTLYYQVGSNPLSPAATASRT